MSTGYARSCALAVTTKDGEGLSERLAVWEDRSVILGVRRCIPWYAIFPPKLFTEPQALFHQSRTDHCGVCIDKGVAGVRCSLLTRVRRRRHDRAKSGFPLEQ